MRYRHLRFRLKRIRVDHGKGFALISPANREAFIAVLMEKVKVAKSNEALKA